MPEGVSIRLGGGVWEEEEAARGLGVEGREGTTGAAAGAAPAIAAGSPSLPAAAAAALSRAARLPLDAPPIAESRCCEEERAKRPGRGARRFVPPLTPLPLPAAPPAELCGEGGRGDGDRAGDGRLNCCCLFHGEREGDEAGEEARRPLLPLRLPLPRGSSEEGGGVPDLGGGAVAAVLLPGSPPPPRRQRGRALPGRARCDSLRWRTL